MHPLLTPDHSHADLHDLEEMCFVLQTALTKCSARLNIFEAAFDDGSCSAITQSTAWHG